MAVFAPNDEFLAKNFFKIFKKNLNTESLLLFPKLEFIKPGWKQLQVILLSPSLLARA